MSFRRKLDVAIMCDVLGICLRCQKLSANFGTHSRPTAYSTTKEANMKRQ